MTRKQKLEQLNKQILNCRKCSGLNIPKKTMSAPGHGIINAELFVIGQSLHSYNPDTPDMQIPFVGNKIGRNDSGVLLYDTLNDAGYSFKKKNLFVTNLVHCHPPKNRKSSKIEISNCCTFLEYELNFVKPKIILSLGSDVRDYFKLPRIIRGYYSQVWSDMKNRKGIPFIIAYHPSYANRGGDNSKSRYKKHLSLSLKQAKTYISNVY